MNGIQDEILRVIQEFSLDVEVFDEGRYQYIFQNVESKFLGGNFSYPLWESIVNKVSVTGTNAWAYLPEFVKDNVVLFLEPEDGQFAMVFKQAGHLQLLLENSFHFVFYLTDLSFTYLLCYNDHDYLIGSGDAKEWVVTLADKVMNDEWRFSARSVTKYDPVFRNEKGHYLKDEWIGFGQLGDTFDGELLTLEIYLRIESKYIDAAYSFFEFHNCDKIVLRNIEKYNMEDYDLEDKNVLASFYHKVSEGDTIPINELQMVVKLILRECMWCELFCISSNIVALRFGYDFYMYFNSDKDMSPLFKRVEGLGLYVW